MPCSLNLIHIFLAENLMSLCRKLIWSREGEHGDDIGEGAGRHTLGSTRRRICSKTTITEHHTKMSEHCIKSNWGYDIKAEKRKSQKVKVVIDHSALI